MVKKASEQCVSACCTSRARIEARPGHGAAHKEQSQKPPRLWPRRSINTCAETTANVVSTVARPWPRLARSPAYSPSASSNSGEGSATRNLPAAKSPVPPRRQRRRVGHDSDRTMRPANIPGSRSTPAGTQPRQARSPGGHTTRAATQPRRAHGPGGHTTPLPRSPRPYPAVAAAAAPDGPPAARSQ